MFEKLDVKPTDLTKPLAFDTGDQKIVYWSAQGQSKMEAIGEFIPQYFGDSAIYVVGRRGSGKSTYCSDYINSYYEQTCNRVFYVSRFTTDPSVSLPPRSLMLDIQQLQDVTLEDLRKSLIVFDDIHSAQLTPKESTYLQKFILDVIENSRHLDCSCIITSHMATNYSKTRPILNECSAVVFFPEYSNPQQVQHMLKYYQAMTPAQVEHLFSLGKDSRWVQLQTINPKFILTQKHIETY